MFRFVFAFFVNVFNLALAVHHSAGRSTLHYTLNSSTLFNSSFAFIPYIFISCEAFTCLSLQLSFHTCHLSHFESNSSFFLLKYTYIWKICFAGGFQFLDYFSNFVGWPVWVRVFSRLKFSVYVLFSVFVCQFVLIFNLIKDIKMFIYQAGGFVEMVLFFSKH